MMNPLAGPAGPGKFSTRTDNLEMPSQFYGEGVETAAMKSGAPLSKTAGARPAQAAEVREAAQEAITPLYAPSQRPDEPITTGIAMGAGAGPEILSSQQKTERLSDILATMLPYDTDGEIAILYQQAVARGL